MLFRIHGNPGDDVVMRPAFTLMTKPISFIACFIGNINNIITIFFGSRIFTLSAVMANGTAIIVIGAGATALRNSKSCDFCFSSSGVVSR